LISATLPHEILEMTSKFMTEPVRILVKRDELTLEVNTNAGFSSINLVSFWQLHIFYVMFLGHQTILCCC
jgi:hypothetical protein